MDGGWAADLAEAIKAAGKQPGCLFLAEVVSIEPFKIKVRGETVKKNIFAWKNTELEYEFKRGDRLVVWLKGEDFYILTKAVQIV